MTANATIAATKTILREMQAYEKALDNVTKRLHALVERNAQLTTELVDLRGKLPAYSRTNNQLCDKEKARTGTEMVAAGLNKMDDELRENAELEITETHELVATEAGGETLGS